MTIDLSDMMLNLCPSRKFEPLRLALNRGTRSP